MVKHSIDGYDILNWFSLGTQEVNSCRKHLNAINVFPVIDGDTGTNLSMTMKAMVEKPKRESTFSGMIQGISESGLANARGNSGIIFASYINGLALEGKTYGMVSIKEFSDIAQRAVGYVYKAIENPVEGTMISVIRDWAGFLFHNHEKFEGFQELLVAGYQTAQVSLQKTKTQLEVLRKNNVVDSGAEGFVRFLNGINRFFTGAEMEVTVDEDANTKFESIEDGTHNFQFCTEVFLEIPKEEASSSDADYINSIKTKLGKYGDSLIVSSQSKKVRVHIHTDKPEVVVETLKAVGTILEQKVDDMFLQNSVRQNRKHKIGILTDSIADIPEEFKLENQIHTLPLSLIVDDVVYLDKLTIKLKQLFHAISKCSTYPTSSQAEPGRINALLSTLLETYDSLIYISVSSKLSGTFNAVSSELKKIDPKGKKVTLIDSRLNSGAQGLIVKAASDLREKGLAHDEIVRQIEMLIPKTKIYVCLDTLEYAVKSGRVPNTVGKIGMKLGLRPIMSLDQKGNGTAFGVGFSKKGMTRKVVKLVEKAIRKGGIKVYSIVHGDNIQLAEELKHRLAQIIGSEPEFVTDISSIIAIHAGLGSIAVCLIEK